MVNAAEYCSNMPGSEGDGVKKLPFDMLPAALILLFLLIVLYFVL